MKRHPLFLLLFASCAAFFAAAAPAYAGAKPVQPDAGLTVTVEHYEGVTLHTDGGAATAAQRAPSSGGVSTSAAVLGIAGAVAVAYGVLTGDVDTAGLILANGAVPATTGEVKELLKELKGDFETEFKSYTERADAEQKQFGKTLSETKESLDRIDRRQDEIETMLQRVGDGTGGEKALTPEQKAGHDAFMAYVKDGKAALEPEQRKALVLDDDGEIIVPEEFENMLYRELPRPVNIRGMAARQTTSSNRVRRATMGELTVGWGKLETNDQNLVDSMGQPTEEYLYVEDLYGLAKIGEDELMDSAFNLEAYVRDSFRRAIDIAEDTAFVGGTGHANHQPNGIVTDIVAANDAGSHIVDTAAAGAVSTDDLLDLKYDLPEQYQNGAGYIVNNKTKGALRKLRDNDGQYLWQPSLQVGAPPSFDGDPVYSNAGVAKIAANAKAVIYGNVSYGYKVVDRLGMTIKRLNELYAEDGMVGFIVHFRVGGGVTRPSAFRLLNVKAA